MKLDKSMIGKLVRLENGETHILGYDVYSKWYTAGGRQYNSSGLYKLFLVSAKSELRRHLSDNASSVMRRFNIESLVKKTPRWQFRASVDYFNDPSTEHRVKINGIEVGLIHHYPFLARNFAFYPNPGMGILKPGFSSKEHEDLTKFKSRLRKYLVSCLENAERQLNLLSRKDL